MIIFGAINKNIQGPYSHKPLTNFLQSLSGTWARYYETLFVRNLRIFVLSKSVCPWQAFLA
jgi:hypothetical protein